MFSDYQWELINFICDSGLQCSTIRLFLVGTWHQLFPKCVYNHISLLTLGDSFKLGTSKLCGWKNWKLLQNLRKVNLNEFVNLFCHLNWTWLCFLKCYLQFHQQLIFLTIFIPISNKLYRSLAIDILLGSFSLKAA